VESPRFSPRVRSTVTIVFVLILVLEFFHLLVQLKNISQISTILKNNSQEKKKERGVSDISEL
jgi:uncharacterized membrane protein